MMLLIIGAIPAGATIRPSFNLDYCSWNATHILLVRTTSRGGVFSVMESLKGDSKPGDSVEVPQLKPSEDSVPISKYTKPQGLGFEAISRQDEEGISGGIPRQPIGSQMILFLKKRGEDGGTSASADGETRMEWEPATNRGIKVSVLWIDGGKAYCFQQLENPGPSALSECSRWPIPSSDIGIFTSRIREVSQVQRELARTLALDNADVRVERLGRIALGNVYEAQIEAMDALGKSGTIALPEVLQVMDQPPAFYDGNMLIRMFVEAAGNDSGRQLQARLQQDLDYWKAIAPTLTQDWTGQLITPGDPLFIKYSETRLIVRELDQEHYYPAAQTVAALRDFWVSQPQLYDPKWGQVPTPVSALDSVHSGLFGFVKDCDGFLTHAGVGKTN